MSARSATIPGKLMLCGEYAVLAGGTALLACLEPRVRATLETSHGVDSSLTIRTDSEQRFTFTYAAGAPQWHGQVVPALVDAVLREFSADDAPRPDGAIRLVLDSSEFFVRGRKLGLGSSAAVAVALSAVLAGALDDDIVALAVRAHHSFQGGTGSGADVRAVAHGGIVAILEDARTSPLALPQGLLMRPVVADGAVSTIDRIARFERWRASADDASVRLSALRSCARKTVSDWQAGDNAGIMSGLRDYREQMVSLSAAAGLDYLDGGHDRLLPIAQRCGVVYKPCGAGGGDLGIALATDDEAMEQFVQQATQAGFTVPAWSVGTAKPCTDTATGAS